MVSLSYLVHVLSSLELLGAILTKVRDGRFTAPPPSFDNHNPLTRSAPSALARKNELFLVHRFMAIPTRMAAREETVCDTGDDDEDSSSEGVHETFLANIKVGDVDVGYVLFPLKNIVIRSDVRHQL